MVLLFFPAISCVVDFGARKGEERSGGKVLRPIQTRLARRSLEKISPARQAQSPQARVADSSSQKRRQLFIRVHNETVPVAVCVSNPDRFPFGIHG
jgi:hypothetical protein